MKKECKSYIRIRGIIKDNPVFDHESYGEKFYKITVLTERLSGTVDEVPVIVSEKIIGIDELKEDVTVNIVGSIRSYNLYRFERKSKLLVFVFANDIEIISDYDICSDVNSTEINGYICILKEIRKTPLRGIEITEFIVAVNRPYGKTDYIPCIAWGRNARYCDKQLKVGDMVSISGRFQSREYIKQFSDGTQEQKVAYEISVAELSKIEEEGEVERNENQEL